VDQGSEILMVVLLKEIALATAAEEKGQVRGLI
jgi:hypothetical protein